MIASKLRPFGVTIFTEMTHLAEEHRSINLSQGFPDFDGPAGIIEAAVAAMRAGENQYARSRGHPLLVRAIAASRRRLYGLEYDPETEIVVCSGCTEAIAASLIGLLDPGDEVILLEPFYDGYPAGLALAGAVPRYLTLRFPDFAVDLDALRRLITPRTRLLVLNTPHNPTGKVFTPAELEGIAALCQEHDLRVLADEVYEHLTYDDAVHLPIASLPGMRERTLTLSSTGKTFSFTGWKIGWAAGPRDLVDATPELGLPRLALPMEEGTSAFDRRMVAELPPEGQQLGGRFLEIEEGHAAIVQAEIDSVTGMGLWFEVMELGLEGGQPPARPGPLAQ